MLRAVLALGGTAAGLAALLSFKTHSPAAAAPVAAPAASTPAATSPATSSTKMASPKKTTGGSGASTATRTITGSVAPTQFGPMQVQLTMTGTKITKATVVQQTDDGGTSQQIDANAIPKLEQETLAAQSARIDTVSGASYTSSGYIQSLQSALDKSTA